MLLSCGWPSSERWIFAVLIRHIAVSKLFFDQLATVTLECNIIGGLKLEANLTQLVYPVLWETAIWFISVLYFLVCCFYAPKPDSKRSMLGIIYRHFAMPKLLLEFKELIAPFVENCLVRIFLFYFCLLLFRWRCGLIAYFSLHFTSRCQLSRRLDRLIGIFHRIISM